MNGVSIKNENRQYTVNLYEDYGLIMTNKTIEPPEVKTYMIDVPGRNGLLDLTDSLVGKPVFGNRKITIEFKEKSDVCTWPVLYSNLLYEFHGKRCRIIFDDDSGYHYLGRISVEPITALGINYCGLKLVADCEPYKNAHELSYIAKETAYASREEDENGKYIYKLNGRTMTMVGNSGKSAKYVVSCLVSSTKESTTLKTYLPEFSVEVWDYNAQEDVEWMSGKVMLGSDDPYKIEKSYASTSGTLPPGRYSFGCKTAQFESVTDFGTITIEWKLYELESKL